MNKDKRAWWEALKAKILGLPPQVETSGSVISPEVIRSDGQGTTNDPRPVGGIQERGGFYIGQRVKWNRRELTKNRHYEMHGTVVGIRDLSYCIRRDDPNGTRDFTLIVKVDDRKTPLNINAGYWEAE